jgi:hypothetical protein
MSFLRNVALGGLGNFSGAFTAPIAQQAAQGNLGILPQIFESKGGFGDVEKNDKEKKRMEKLIQALMQGGGMNG